MHAGKVSKPLPFVLFFFSFIYLFIYCALALDSNMFYFNVLVSSCLFVIFFLVFHIYIFFNVFRVLNSNSMFACLELVINILLLIYNIRTTCSCILNLGLFC